jgi:predicted branched-subunit amino acid permease
MMATSTTKKAFWRGVREGFPFILVAGPFALVFGVLATESGLNIAETMGFSIVVIAGAAQLTAVQMMADSVPTIIVLASALAVNLRMAMYSAALTPYIGGAPLWQRAFAAYFLVDQAYALSAVEYEKRPDLTVPDRMGYFFGSVIPVCIAWYGCTYLGAVLGTRIPPEWALDFAVPIAFLALIAPMLRTPAHLVAAFTGSVVALLAAGVPYSLGPIIGGLAGMAAGAQVELMLDRRRA